MRVIGLGNRMRSDDGAGLEVARRLALKLPREQVAECTGDASELIALWSGQDQVIVVDASLSGRAVGEIHWHDGFDLAFSDRGMAASSHALSLKEAVALGKTLGALPGELQVVAIEGETFAFGDEMTAPVLAAVEKLSADLLARCSRPAFGNQSPKVARKPA